MNATHSLLATALLMAASVALAQDADHSEHAPPEAARGQERTRDAAPQTAAPATDHSAMDHSAMQRGGAADPPRTAVPELTDADRAAAQAPSSDHSFTDNAIHGFLLLNRLEAWNADGGIGIGWEAEGWMGTDLNRLWLRSEGERNEGEVQAADLEALYGRSISAWWDVVGGVRHDFRPGESQTFAALGIQGLAPQRFEIAATAYFGEGSRSAVRFEAEYALLFTNRLILQPLVEIEAFGKSDAARRIGSGLSSAEVGLRLRYEFTRRLAPYIGLNYERALGNTADLLRDASEEVGDWRFVAGVRTWF